MAKWSKFGKPRNPKKIPKLNKDPQTIPNILIFIGKGNLSIEIFAILLIFYFKHENNNSHHHQTNFFNLILIKFQNQFPHNYFPIYFNIHHNLLLSYIYILIII